MVLDKIQLPIADLGGLDHQVPVNDGGGSLTVDGSVAVSALPPITGAVTVTGGPVSVTDGGGSLTVDPQGGTMPVSGTVSATQGTVPWITAGTATVTGTVTANQGGAPWTVADGGGSLTVDGTVAVSALAGTSDVNVVEFGGSPVSLIDGCPCISAKDYFVGVAEGDVPGHEEEDFFGERTTVSNTAGGEDVWNGSAAVTPRPADAGVLVSVVSTSGSDTLAGAGAQVVTIQYIDPNGDQQTTTVNMAGAVAVNTGILMRFIQKMWVSQIGTAYGAAVGTITAHLTGTPGTVYEAIPAGANRSTSAHYFVPRGKTFYLTEWFASASGTKAVTVRLRATSMEGVRVAGIPYSHFTIQLLDSTYIRALAIPHDFPALTIISLRAVASASGASVAAGARGWIE